MVSGKPLKILIVDDSASLRAVLRPLFANEGYHVVGDLARGQGLDEAVERLRPDIVCLDYHLPDGDGIEFLELIHGTHPEVAVVMITGDANPDLEHRAAEAGATGFIRKPFTPARIATELRQIAQVRALLADGHALNEPPKAPRARAVVADDSAAMRLLLTRILHQAAVEVVGQACNGEEAIGLVSDFSPEIICLDLDMPVMNGLDALRAIRAQQNASKILMITGRTDRDAVLQAAKGGATGYIVKPFQPDKVVEAINKLLN